MNFKNYLIASINNLQSINNNEFIEIQRKFSEYHNECPIFINSLRFLGQRT